jgi:hypothetical protein
MNIQRNISGLEKKLFEIKKPTLETINQKALELFNASAGSKGTSVKKINLREKGKYTGKHEFHVTCNWNPKYNSVFTSQQESDSAVEILDNHAGRKCQTILAMDRFHDIASEVLWTQYNDSMRRAQGDLGKIHAQDAKVATGDLRKQFKQLRRQ